MRQEEKKGRKIEDTEQPDDKFTVPYQERPEEHDR